MKEHESPEAVEARATQEDPIVMYLIVRESLGMSIGKTAAQCAHASQMLTLKYFDLKKEFNNHQKMILSPPSSFPDFVLDKFTEDRLANAHQKYRELRPQLSIFEDWIQSSFRKVVLRASDKEWGKLKEEFKDSMIMVVDAGLTEIASGSETVIGLWPIRKSQVSKTIKKLQVLK